MSSQTLPAVLVDNQDAIIGLVDTIMALPSDGAHLFLDLEGISLSRHGTLSIVTIYIRSSDRAYLVDVHQLGAAAFSACNADGHSLKSILESPQLTKVFFDVRNDSDALFSHYGIALKGIEDVQLMENVLRSPGRRTYVMGLQKTIQYHAPLTQQQKWQWERVKDMGVGLFHPSRGGTYEVFNKRPLHPDVEKYCVNDVQYLPGLRDRFWARLEKSWMAREKAMVMQETEKRVKESQAVDYEPQSESKRFGPWGP
ncbi:ribonuclease H-like domain-containing protein [Thelonectria olida]|uniref:Ribonuclease H-like domain-containing protein n=1 Tax=Thelonectria olida TaxID=1576542 RepID=A0A9P9ATN0_9HYPO|nr:ribonuclease H-like domain-containing protein [Thelonectria olida]